MNKNNLTEFVAGPRGPDGTRGPDGISVSDAAYAETLSVVIGAIAEARLSQFRRPWWKFWSRSK